MHGYSIPIGSQMGGIATLRLEIDMDLKLSNVWLNGGGEQEESKKHERHNELHRLSNMMNYSGSEYIHLTLVVRDDVSV